MPTRTRPLAIPGRTSASPAWMRAALAVTCLTASLIALPHTLHAQDRAPQPTFRAPLADPVVEADARFSATRITAWRDGETRYLLLDGDARFEMGVYRFAAQRAVVRIDREQAPGRPVHHIALVLDRVTRGVGGRIDAEARSLLVTASTTGDLSLATDLLTPREQAPADPLVDKAQARIARHRLALSEPVIDFDAPPPYDADTDGVRAARREAIRKANRAERLTVVPPSGPAATPTDPEDAAPAARTTPADILPTRGVVRLRADRGPIIQRATDGQQPYIALIGNVVVLYEDYDRDRQMTMKADKVLLFLRDQPGEAAALGGEVAAGLVEGVYLEDHAIITDGQYTVRAPRAYYDVQANKAALLDAVMFTYDIERQVPLYLRAQTLRQTSATSFEARRARLTTSEFAEPHFSIGASRVTVRNVGATAAGYNPRFEVDHAVGRWYDMPLFYLPALSGSAENFPLRAVAAGSDNNGGRIETRWDLFALAGKESPDGVSLLGDLSYLGEHGPAVGADLDYDLDHMFGRSQVYLLPYDDGSDEIADRNEITFDGDFRGFGHLQHRHLLPENIELSLEAAYVSDETFLEEFFGDEASEAKEYETSVYVKKQENDWALDMWARYDINEFTPQLTTLQTPGYTVDRGPEVRYFRTGADLFDGRLTWYSENRIGQVRANAGDDRPADRGFTAAQSADAFGIPATTRFSDALEAAGISDDWIGRADSRHEVAMPLQLGPADVTPYLVGRVTAYDDDFAVFNGGNDDQVRLFGGGGVRAATELHRTFNDFNNDLLDAHRLRHIIEPHADLSWFGQTIDSGELPIYDPQVEGINDGATVRLGLTNTLQTERGGQGRRRSVDWVRLTTDFIFRDDEADDAAPLPHYFAHRPEYSTGGDHFYSELLWMVTESVAFAGDVTYSLESDEIAQWRAGLSVRHTPRLSYHVAYNEINVLERHLLSYGFEYDLTAKYDLSFVHRLDLDEGATREVEVMLDRQLPRWRLRALLAYDEIEDEVVFGIVLFPEGLNLNARPMTVVRSN